MKNSLFFFPLFLVCLFFANCAKEEQATPSNENENPTEVDNPPTVPKGDFRIAFYNVENLFDTQDDMANEKDNEFLPMSKKEWTTERYQKKLSNIAEVIGRLEFPILMGLAEVENRAVLEDLTNLASLRAEEYGIIHEDSPDFRGIDVALIYKKSDFTVLSHQSIDVNLPAAISTFSTTRDILMVQGRLKGEEIYLFINHWPSRSGGIAATAEKRKFAAEVLRNAVDNILVVDPNANIIIMGDLNDEPYNESVAEVLKAQTQKSSNIDNQLYNCTISALMEGEGSYKFDGDWQMYDQFIVSGQLLNEEGDNKVLGFQVFKEELILFNHPDDGLMPNRTYGGNSYFGGYSDHLPVFLEVAE